MSGRHRLLSDRPMSALGQKQTSQSVLAMSALPPESGHKTAVRDLSKPDVRFGAENVRSYPDSGHVQCTRAMSALGQ